MRKRVSGSRALMILNRQRAVRVRVGELEHFLERARRKLGIPSGAVTVCMVTNAQMARWNRAFRNKRGATDVLSFPGHDSIAADTERHRRPRSGKSTGTKKNGLSSASSISLASSACSYLGDIAIAPAVARENACRCGRSLSDELRILVLHGLLHLLGYDHETDHGQMDRFEGVMRRSLGLAQT